MSCLLLWKLFEINADRQIGKRCCRKIHGIGKIVSACGNNHVGLAGKAQSFVGSFDDFRRRRRNWPRDVDRGEMQRLVSEAIRNAHAQLRSAERQMHDLAQRRVVKIISRERVLRLGKLLGRGPGSDPMRLRLSRKIEKENQEGS